MKQILFNYFLSDGDGLFKEKRMAWVDNVNSDDPKEPQDLNIGATDDLETQKAKLKEEIDDAQKGLDQLKGQRDTLKADIDVASTKRRVAEKVSAHWAQARLLLKQVGEKTTALTALEKRLETYKESTDTDWVDAMKAQIKTLKEEIATLQEELEKVTNPENVPSGDVTVTPDSQVRGEDELKRMLSKSEERYKSNLDAYIAENYKTEWEEVENAPNTELKGLRTRYRNAFNETRPSENFALTKAYSNFYLELGNFIKKQFGADLNRDEPLTWTGSGWEARVPDPSKQDEFQVGLNDFFYVVTGFEEFVVTRRFLGTLKTNLKRDFIAYLQSDKSVNVSTVYQDLENAQNDYNSALDKYIEKNYTEEWTAVLDVNEKAKDELRTKYDKEYRDTLAKDHEKIKPETRGAIYENLKKHKLNPDGLKVNTEPDLVKTMDAFLKAGLPEDSVMWMAGALKYPFTDEFATKFDEKQVEDREMIAIFTNPTEQNIEDPRVKADNPEFYYAFVMFTAIKKQLVEAQMKINKMADNKMKQNQEPATTYLMDKASEIGHDFANAVSNRDYSKMALYGVFGYGVYKLMKGLGIVGGGHGAKKEDGIGWKGAVLGLAAAYAGGWVLAPEYMKKMIGKGKNMDVKGTYVEDLVEFGKTSPEAYAKAIDGATLMAINDAKIKNVYAPLAKDSDATKRRMIPLNSPGIVGFFDPDLISEGNVNFASLDNPGYKLTARQKIYVDACHTLYENAEAMKKMYEANIMPRTRVSFEDAFLNDKPDNPHYEGALTMGALYAMLSQFAGNPENEWMGLNVDKVVADDLTNPDSETTQAFRGSLLKLNNYQNNKVTGTIYGFPIIIRPKKAAKEGERNTYYFALVNMPEEEFDYTAGVNSESTARTLKEKITTYIRSQTSKLSFVPQDGTKKPDPTFDPKEANGKNSGWVYEVDSQAYFLVPAGKVKVHLNFNAKGQVEWSTPEKEGRHALIDNMFDPPEHSNFYPLIVMKDGLTPEMITNENQKDNSFDLTIAGITTKVRVRDADKTHDKYYAMSPADQKKLLGSEEFQRKYAEARFGIDVKENQQLIETAKRSIKNINEEWLLSPFQTIMGAVDGTDHWSDIIAGSGKEGLAEVLITSRLDMFKALEMTNANTSRNFSEFENNEKAINDRYLKLKTFVNKLEQYANDKSMNKGDFERLVSQGATNAGIYTELYRINLLDFEKRVAGKVGYLEYFESKRDQAKILMAVYYKYTADLDTPSKQESRQDYNGVESYLSHVKNAILNQSDEILDGRAFTINTYKEYIREYGQAPLKPMDTLDKYTDVLEMKNFVAGECKKQLDILINDYPALSPVLVRFYNNSNAGSGRFEEFAKQILAYPGYATRSQQEAAATDYAEKVFYKTANTTAKEKYHDFLEWKPGFVAWLDQKYLEVTGTIFPWSAQ